MASKNPFGQVAMAKMDPSNAAEKGKYQDFDEPDTRDTRNTVRKDDLEAT